MRLNQPYAPMVPVVFLAIPVNELLHLVLKMLG